MFFCSMDLEESKSSSKRVALCILLTVSKRVFLGRSLVGVGRDVFLGKMVRVFSVDDDEP